jgi:hypothetical protein
MLYWVHLDPNSNHTLNFSCGYWFLMLYVQCRGGFRGGHTRRVAPPLKLEKIWFFGVKSWFFHTKYPKNVRASLCSAQFFDVHPPPNFKSWIRPCNVDQNLTAIYMVVVKKATSIGHNLFWKLQYNVINQPASLFILYLAEFDI